MYEEVSEPLSRIWEYLLALGDIDSFCHQSQAQHHMQYRSYNTNSYAAPPSAILLLTVHIAKKQRIHIIENIY